MNKGSNYFSMIGQLRTNFGSNFMNFGAMIINYELITNYQRLIITYTINK
jgi:hypothetical protein